MKLPGPAREIQSNVGRAKGKVKRVESQAKRAESTTKKVTGKTGGSKPTAAPEPAAESAAAPEAEPVVASELMTEEAPAPAPPVQAGSTAMSASVQYAIVGILGAVGAVLLGLAVANNTNDRLLFPLIGIPLGAILAIGVVASLHWAELLDHSD